MAADAALVERVRQGDVEAFEVLVRRYERRAYAVAYRLLRHREDAEDLVQESFMIALGKLDTFDARRAFGPWFFRLLVNRGLNLRDRRRVRETQGLSEEMVSAGETPERAAERTELQGRVAEALASLSDRQRLVVQLYELDGFSVKEVAEALDVAESTVRWTLHTARNRLRHALAPLKENQSHA